MADGFGLVDPPAGGDVRTEFHVGALPNAPIDDIANLAALAEQLSFDGFWLADSQSIFRDAFGALVLAASRTSSIELGTAVTNPVTRHPAVVAGAAATLDELSGGRAMLGVGVGDSAVHTLGLKPAKLRELEEWTHAVRALLAGGTGAWHGNETRLTWWSKEVPIWFASTGPKSLELAGRVADGVLFQVGAHPDLVRYGLRHIEKGGRTIRRLVRLSCTVDSDRDAARTRARAYATVAAGTIYQAIPPDEMPEGLHADLKRMKENYDYFQHGGAAGRQAELVTDLILDSTSIAGTPDEAVTRLRELSALGVDGFILTTADPAPTMRALAERVLPALRGT